MSYKFALLGSLPKGDEARKSWQDWKLEYKNKFLQSFPDAEFVDGDAISDKVGPELVVGHDLSLIKCANIVIVDARSKIGAGTAQEMVLAKYFRKPLVSVVPKDTHHRKSSTVFDGTVLGDWIHPFIYVSSDYIAENIEDAIKWILESESTSKKIKGMDIFDKCISKFENAKNE